METEIPLKRKGVTPILTSIYAKNFGPIYEASIPVKNFTIIMGPNNSGKTFLALLTWLALYTLMLVQTSRTFLKKIIKKKSTSEMKELMEEFFAVNISDKLCELYTVESPSELINKQADRAEIEFGFHIGEEKVKLGVSIFKDHIVPKIPDLRTELNVSLHDIVYVPAERAGIMRTYRQLLRLHLETSWPRPVIKQLKKYYETLVGKLLAPPGSVKIFLDEILSIETFNTLDLSSFQKNALEMLRNAIGGELLMKEDLSITYKDEFSGVEIPLERSSSSVSEIAGIYLLTKFLSKDRLLVVEEPESHLHPRAQMMMARYFARLVRNGVRIFVTTHSDLLALKAAQLVGLHKISEDDRVKLNYDRNEYLERDELAIHFLEIREKGSISREIEISPYGEIEDLPTYGSVVEEMYGEAIKLLELYGKIPRLS